LEDSKVGWLGGWMMKGWKSGSFQPSILPSFQYESVGQIGPTAKCAPPLRDAGRREEMWKRLRALLDLQGSGTIGAEQLLYRHAISPYVGWKLRAIVKGTWVRGREVYCNGKVTAQGRGKLLTPDLIV
jgi:dihydroorotase-like cyclic amidohydrolase